MPTVEDMRVIMDAETARLHRKLTEADRRMAQFQRDTAQRLKAFDGYFRSAGAAVGALVGALGTRQIIEYANAWTRTERALAASEQIFGMQLHSAKELTGFANEARIDLESYTKTYFRTAAAIRDYGFGADQAAKMTTALSMALKLGGAAASEQASVLLQYSQALNKGKLDGDEFRSVMENAPVVVELLSERLKASKGEIINWAREGKLQVKDLVGALTDGADKIGRIFNRMPQTVDESLTVLRTAVTAYVGERDKMLGGTEKLVAAITTLSRNIDVAGDGAMVLGAGLLSAFGPRVLKGAVAVGAGIGAIAGPLSIVLGLVGAGATAMSLFGDQVHMSSYALATLNDGAIATATVLGQDLSRVFAELGREIADLVKSLVAGMNGVEVNWDAVMSGMRRALLGFVGTFIAAVRSIRVLWNGLGDAIREQAYEWTAAVVKKVEDMVKSLVMLVNVLPGVKIDVESLINFESSEPNKWAGAGSKLREDMAKAGETIGGVWADAVEKRIADKMRELADLRSELQREQRRAQAFSKVGFTPKRGKLPVDQKLIDEQKKAYEKLQDLHQKALAASEQYVAKVISDYEQELRKFKEMHDKKLITTEQFNQARQDLAVIAAKQMNEAIEKEYKRLREVTDIFSSNMADAFKTWTDGGKLDVRDMVRSMIADLARLAFQMNVLRPLFGDNGRGFGLIGSLFGIGGGSALADAGGGIGAWTTTTQAFASGGRPPLGVPSLVGERGPELFVPDVRGTIVPNDRLGSMGGNPVSVQFSIDARGATRDTVPILERQLAELQRNLPRIITETVRETRERRVI